MAAVSRTAVQKVRLLGALAAFGPLHLLTSLISCPHPPLPPLHAVMGALIGIQAGRELEVVNSFEVAAVLNQETKQWSIKHDFFEQRQSQCEFSGHT